MKTFYSHGKLLLSGEYLVLDGARALALPTRPGQWLHIRQSDAPDLEWKSLEIDGRPWFETRFSIRELNEATSGEHKPSTDIRGRLLQILGTALRLAPDFLKELQGSSVEAQLEFPREWGLGSSSTLISNLAYWSGTDPYTLLDLTFGGSGYDIAAAREDGPFLFCREADSPKVVRTAFSPEFSEELFFVYLNQKQDSREGISRYRNRTFDKSNAVQMVSELTDHLVQAATLTSFCDGLDRHELLISDILEIPPVKTRLFPDYPGSIKSLGAWGGDFILATGPDSYQEYFRSRGFTTIRSYNDLIL